MKKYKLKKTQPLTKLKETLSFYETILNDKNVTLDDIVKRVKTYNHFA